MADCIQIEPTEDSIHDKCREIFVRHNEPNAHRMSDDDLVCALEKGVLLCNSLYWLDGSRRICCEKFARGLTIIWGSTPQYWTYKTENLISSGHCIETAELLNVCWVEVHGHFNSNFLVPNTVYEVVYDVKMLPCASGWNRAVKFKLTTPDGSKVESEKDMKQYVGQGYKEITVGKFRVPLYPSDEYWNGRVELRLEEIEGGLWKKGLVVRGVIIRPARCWN